MATVFTKRSREWKSEVRGRKSEGLGAEFPTMVYPTLEGNFGPRTSDLRLPKKTTMIKHNK